jgi:hypothetical protein
VDCVLETRPSSALQTEDQTNSRPLPARVEDPPSLDVVDEPIVAPFLSERDDRQEEVFLIIDGTLNRDVCQR